MTAVAERVPAADSSSGTGSTRHVEISRSTRTMDALRDVGIDALLTSERFGHVDLATVGDVIGEFVRFVDDVVAPTDREGDVVGCRVDTDAATVTTSPGTVDAYRRYVRAGWGAVPFSLDEGGGGLPKVVGVAMQEVFASGNLGLSLCPALTQSAIELLSQWGSESQRQRYLPRLVTGEWNGTMQITEPDAGSDVGAVRTSARPLGDGRYALSGTKIFISWGEHDLTENIVHLVLARTPGAASGTKGLSLFVVPKYPVADDGSLGERNPIWCRSIEHKLGLHSSPTCVMELDGAIGELVGAEQGGMRAMFSMMNPARLAIGLQGLSVGEAAYAEARAYAAQRRQSTALGGVPGTPDTIDQHPDVRRMLSSMRSTLDAMRLVVYTTAIHSDGAATDAGTAAGERHQDMVDLLTPIAKAWVTDLGVEIASLGIQVLGGVGYSEEMRAAQRWRDARIAPIYEGTNGIQAIDLVTRKLTRHGGALIASVLDDVDATAERLGVTGASGSQVAEALTAATRAVRPTVDWLLRELEDDRAAALAGATPFLSVFGDLIGGWLLAERVLGRDGDQATEALDVAAYYASERLVTVLGRCRTVTTGAGRLFV